MPSLPNEKRLRSDPERLDTQAGEWYSVVRCGQNGDYGYQVLGPSGTVVVLSSWNLADKIARALERADHEGFVRAWRLRGGRDA